MRSYLHITLLKTPSYTKISTSFLFSSVLIYPLTNHFEMKNFLGFEMELLIQALKIQFINKNVLGIIF